MKKKAIIMLAAMAVAIFAGCTQNDEKLIVKAMNKYAKDNFSDPNDYRGIESMKQIDEKDWNERARIAINNQSWVDSICKADADFWMEIFHKANSDTPYHSYYNAKEHRKFDGDDFREKRKELSNYFTHHTGSIHLNYNFNVLSIVDSLLSRNKFEPFKTYEVKARIKSVFSTELVTNKYTAYVFKGYAVIADDECDAISKSKIKNKDAYITLIEWSNIILETQRQDLWKARKAKEAAEEVQKFYQ